ncbi:hypothetical protein V6R21_05785 [Limibacter armeniacum]|uniref:hypothetical protein n=1 Tax=Limibacter armeniacum TaxID=466084 RepID=UPI002FE5BE6F
MMIQDMLLEKISNQCPTLMISESSQWKITRQGGGIFDLESQSDAHKAFLNLYLETEDSELMGYYDLETDSSFLNFRLVKCDTTIYFEMKPKNGKVDTIFHIGYYKYLYDRNLLTGGQKRFFRRNRDSLISLRGDNLKPLPEIEVIFPPDNPAFEPIDN